MEKDIERNLMDFAYRFCESLGIANYNKYNYDTRGELLDLIKQKNKDAFEVLNNYYNFQETADLIKKEYSESDHVLWMEKYWNAKTELQNAGKVLVDFARENNIDLNGLF